jgi:hypothetical protein
MEEFSVSYNGFSGVDIEARTDQYKYAKIQAIGISKTREMAPIYTIGSADPRVFVREIAGTLIFNKLYVPEPVRKFNIHFKRADDKGKISRMGN